MTFKPQHKQNNKSLFRIINFKTLQYDKYSKFLTKIISHKTFLTKKKHDLNNYDLHMLWSIKNILRSGPNNYTIHNCNFQILIILKYLIMEFGVFWVSLVQHKNFKKLLLHYIFSVLWARINFSYNLHDLKHTLKYFSRILHH